LKQNLFRDDRRDVLASTRAALDYLQQLHQRFGDWHLALAAYNWGQGNVNRAITRNTREGLGTSYTDLTMPLETRQYVPKLQAVKNIIAQPQAFGVRLPAIGNFPFFDSVSIERDMDVALIARLAGVSEADFRTLNPSLNKPMVMAAATPEILLPRDNAIAFLTQLRQYKGSLASWTAWQVPQTMSVAQAAQRVGMSESALRELNRIPPRMMVRAGSSLLVERSQGMDRDVPEHIVDNAQLSLQPEVVLRRVTVKARKGDTVARLAARYGVSPAQVANWNAITPKSKLKAGQQLTIMQSRKAAATDKSHTADASPARAGAKSKAKDRPRASANAQADRARKGAGATPSTRASSAQTKRPAQTGAKAKATAKKAGTSPNKSKPAKKT
jgi:membrane-bound lytic murein transglycosylase D